MSNIVCPGCQAVVSLSSEVTALQVCALCGAEFTLQPVLVKAGSMLPTTMPAADKPDSLVGNSLPLDDGTIVIGEEATEDQPGGLYGGVVLPEPAAAVGSVSEALTLSEPATSQSAVLSLATPAPEFVAETPLAIPITAATVASESLAVDVAMAEAGTGWGTQYAGSGCGGAVAEFVGTEEIPAAIGVAAGEIPVVAEPAPESCSTLQCAVADLLIGDGETTIEVVTAEQPGDVVAREALAVADEKGLRLGADAALAEDDASDTYAVAADDAPADETSAFLASVAADASEPTSIARAAAAKRKQQGPGPIAHFIGVVGGAVVGLAIAYYLLNLWDSRRFNFLKIWLPGIKYTDEQGPE